MVFFFFSSRRRHTRFSRDWSSDVCSSDLGSGSRGAPRPHITGPSGWARRRTPLREGKGGLRIRRSIALVLAASLFLVMAEQAQAATVDISIVSASAGFDSKAAAGAFADTFRWTNNDTITHTTTQKRSALAV